MNIVTLEHRQKTLLGTAAWYSGGGVLVRKCQKGDVWIGRTDDGRVCGYRDDRHTFLCAGTRGGKGISLIVPNLIAWEGSILVVDPKGENAIITARSRGRGSPYSRGRGQKVLILDPFDEIKTPHDDFSDVKARFNPLDMLSADNEESVDEAARLAEAMVVTEANADPFFEPTAQSLTKSVILHVVSSPDFRRDERNLVTVRRLIVSGDMKARKLAERSGKKKIPSAHEFLFLAMRSSAAFGGIVANYGAMFLDMSQKADRTFMGVLSSAALHTEFIESPGMRRCLSASDFKLSELKTNPKGISIYLCLPERYRETHFRWLRMMVALTLAEMERVRQQPASNYPVLMVLDEFPALRRMRSIENAAAQVAGFGVKLFFVVQTLAQLRDLYKDNWETLLANAGGKFFFCNDDHFTRKYVSDLIGETEVIKTVRSYSESQGESFGYSESTGVSSSRSSSFSQTGSGTSATSGVSNSVTVSHGRSNSQTSGISETIHKRPLITPDEVGRMFGDRERPATLAVISGYQPTVLTRTFYFEEKGFRGHYDGHPDHAPPLTLVELHAVIQQEKADAEAERRRLEEEAAERKAQKERQALKSKQCEIEMEAYWRRQQRRYRRFCTLIIGTPSVIILLAIAYCLL